MYDFRFKLVFEGARDSLDLEPAHLYCSSRGHARENGGVMAVKVPKVILAIEYKKAPEVQEKWLPSPPLEPESVKTETRAVQLPDLLVYFWVWNLDDHVPQSASLDEKNALALGLWLLY
ncbi:hypothetical protein POM88_007272 [Heracleum sosnowskyi]|uniref:Uncharacterized protein n=1 Tax=Heracleum sosnowskyi TaxID=360622 RepID=A0AAD8J5T6_9APIA|nr:hypothetical protein POM88_007272 [Heracleum sosnowskyi]